MGALSKATRKRSLEPRRASSVCFRAVTSRQVWTHPSTPPSGLRTSEAKPWIQRTGPSDGTNLYSAAPAGSPFAARFDCAKTVSTSSGCRADFHPSPSASFPRQTRELAPALVDVLARAGCVQAEDAVRAVRRERTEHLARPLHIGLRGGPFRVRTVVAPRHVCLRTGCAHKRPRRLDAHEGRRSRNAPQTDYRQAVERSEEAVGLGQAASHFVTSRRARCPSARRTAADPEPWTPCRRCLTKPGLSRREVPAAADALAGTLDRRVRYVSDKGVSS